MKSKKGDLIIERCMDGHQPILYRPGRIPGCPLCLSNARVRELELDLHVALNKKGNERKRK